MSDSKEQLLAKARKLMALANPENGGFENEIKIASRKLQELMTNYNLDWAELLLSKSEQERTLEFVKKVCTTLFGKIKPWQWSLARSIDRIAKTKHFSTSIYGKSYREKNNKRKQDSWQQTMAFFGGDTQAQMAAELWDEWVVKIDLMARKAAAEYCEDLSFKYGVLNPIQNFKQMQRLSYETDSPLEDEDHPNVWRYSWVAGVVAGIDHVTWEQEKAEREAQTDHTTAAIVLVTKELEKAYEEFSVSFRTTRMHSTARKNYAAYSAGKAVGISVSLGAKKLGG